jgi:hypothetical protein
MIARFGLILLFFFQADARIENLLAFHRANPSRDVSTLFATRGGGLFGKGDKATDEQKEENTV